MPIGPGQILSLAFRVYQEVQDPCHWLLSILQSEQEKRSDPNDPLAPGPKARQTRDLIQCVMQCSAKQEPDGDDYVLVKFIPLRIELMSFASGVLPKPYGLKPAAVVRSEDLWILADNG